MISSDHHHSSYEGRIIITLSSWIWCNLVLSARAVMIIPTSISERWWSLLMMMMKMITHFLSAAYAMWNQAHQIFDFQKEVIALQIFFGRALQKKRAIFTCALFLPSFFFWEGFFFNPFFFCSASFCLFDNLSILSDYWGCLGCRQCRSNQKYAYRVPTLLQNIYIQPKIWGLKLWLFRALFFQKKKGVFFLTPFSRPFFFVRVFFFFFKKKGAFFERPFFALFFFLCPSFHIALV